MRSDISFLFLLPYAFGVCLLAFAFSGLAILFEHVHTRAQVRGWPTFGSGKAACVCWVATSALVIVACILGILVGIAGAVAFAG